MPTSRDNESRNLRQMVVAVFVGFSGGFILSLAVVVFVIARILWPEAGWWALAELVRGVFIAGFGGMVVAWAAMSLVVRRQYRLGMHRCAACDRALRAASVPCVCDAAGWARYRRLQRLPNRTLRHFRRRLPVLLVIYLLVLLVAVYIALRHTRPGWWSFAADVVQGHAVLCTLVAVLLHLTDVFPGLFPRGRRLRLRVAPLVQFVVIWPCAFAVAMVVYGSWRGT